MNELFAATAPILFGIFVLATPQQRERSQYAWKESFAALRKFEIEKERTRTRSTERYTRSSSINEPKHEKLYQWIQQSNNNNSNGSNNRAPLIRSSLIRYIAQL